MKATYSGSRLGQQAELHNDPLVTSRPTPDPSCQARGEPCPAPTLVTRRHSRNIIILSRAANNLARNPEIYRPRVMVLPIDGGGCGPDG